MISGFQNKVLKPDFFAGRLQEAKRPGHGGSEADGPHQVIAQGEFDRTVKSDFTTAPNPTLFWRGPVRRTRGSTLYWILLFSLALSVLLFEY